MSAGTRVRGNSGVLRVALIWVLRGPVAYEEGLREPQLKASPLWASRAMTGVTFLRDGMANPIAEKALTATALCNDDSVLDSVRGVRAGGKMPP